jgi:hypothetical protein
MAPIAERQGRKRSENSIVHEAQMRFANLGLSANQSWMKFAFVAHFLTALSYTPQAEALGIHSTSAVGHCSDITDVSVQRLIENYVRTYH